MFRKTLRIRSNFQLKSSDRKKLLCKVQDNFSLTDEDVRLLFLTKEPITVLKICTQSLNTATVYMCLNTPLFYEMEDMLYPTVYSLWRFPLIMPSVRIHHPVVAHILNGADLMIPGVIPKQLDLEETNYPAGSLVYLNTDKNIAAIAIGITQVSSREMILPGTKGKAVQILHSYDDFLCKLGGNENIPDLGATFDNVPFSGNQLSQDIERLLLEDSAEAPPNIPPSLVDTQSMDDLIKYSFLKAIKFMSSTMDIPILTNVFYKKYLLKSVPKDMNLDLRKTRYKKLSFFLAKMEEFEIITTRLNSIGSQHIIKINLNHPMVENFELHEEDELLVDNTPLPEVVPIQINEKLVINGLTEAILQKYRCKRGDSFSECDMRQLITRYINDNQLVDKLSAQYVTLNKPLQELIQTKKPRITWKELFEGVFAKMGRCYEIHFPDNKIIFGKGKLLPIELFVIFKASNKKVTLVNNLELYGISLAEFSRECQRGVAASSTINVVPNSKSAQFQIQGNQKHFIGKLLTDKYAIPKKYIQGLEEQKSKKR